MYVVVRQKNSANALTYVKARIRGDREDLLSVNFNFLARIIPLPYFP